jgi:hypothetical protein
MEHVTGNFSLWDAAVMVLLAVLLVAGKLRFDQFRAEFQKCQADLREARETIKKQNAVIGERSVNEINNRGNALFAAFNAFERFSRDEFFQARMLNEAAKQDYMTISAYFAASGNEVHEQARLAMEVQRSAQESVPPH